MRDTVAIHVPCSSKKMGIEEAFTKLAGLCANEVVQSGIPCCGMAGDRCGARGGGGSAGRAGAGAAANGGPGPGLGRGRSAAAHARKPALHNQAAPSRLGP